MTGRSIKFFVFVKCLFLFSTIQAQEKREMNPNEAKIKAAFIYNFSKYIEWPEGTSTEVIYVGIDHQDELLNELLQSERSKSNLRVVNLKDIEYLEDLHIIYSNDEHMLNRINGKPILLVSDENEPEQCMIQFNQNHQRLIFTANDSLLELHQLRVAHK